MDLESNYNFDTNTVNVIMTNNNWVKFEYRSPEFNFEFHGKVNHPSIVQFLNAIDKQDQVLQIEGKLIEKDFIQYEDIKFFSSENQLFVFLVSNHLDTPMKNNMMVNLFYSKNLNLIEISFDFDKTSLQNITMPIFKWIPALIELETNIKL